MTEFEPIIGLEVHAELQTRSKMFCGCAVVDSVSATANTRVCEICTGMPGTLPVINRRAVEFAIRVALALHCEIAETSIFARKNYFYPDLPKGFQISQYELPLAVNGWMMITTNGEEKRIAIRRVHLEEDTGKLTHRQTNSLIDYNRSGVPLLEIVSEPDLRSIDEVRAYAIALRSLLRFLEVSSADMEKGVIRFEANISVRPQGAEILGTRTEIKNLNSLRAMAQAISYEIDRQSRLLANGQEVRQETLGWDEGLKVTVPQRGKEEAHDYRYFPEPDLPPLHLERSWIEEIRAKLPELARAKRQRYVDELKLNPYTADVLTNEKDIADYFEATVAAAPDLPAQQIGHWIGGPLFSLLNDAGIKIRETLISVEQLSELIGLVELGKISNSSAKAVLTEMFASGAGASQIIEAQGLEILADSAIIDGHIEKVLVEFPDQVQQYLLGKEPIFEWLFGQVMRATSGRSDPQRLRQALARQLRALDKRQPPA
ncbi:MAG: Asp-tRNA(Asn)/Glu-tRNA(Gln) amidotransferase subunit GatB [Chloroflexi bacterium]|nr:Asp-tRNA(Asn)/Glu-tRNA(Gln) amidotransferase subunit GatB [Chloroflexota bacterium]